jgi:hypothetical protein
VAVTNNLVTLSTPSITAKVTIFPTSQLSQSISTLIAKLNWLRWGIEYAWLKYRLPLVLTAR